MRILTLIIFFVILLVNLVSAGPISIKKVESSDVKPGETSEINIILENQGDDDIEDVSVSLDLSNDLPFAPIGSSAEKTLDEIEEDDEEEISFELITMNNAKPKIYKIPITIKYNEIQESSVISIKVISQPELEVAIEESEIYKTGDTGKITIRFVNKGLSDIKFLTASLQESKNYNIISVSSFYVGNIEPDDFETITFTLNLKNKISSLPIKVEYQDSENKFYTTTEFLDINIYSEEEAKKLGLTKTNYTLIIALIVVALIIIFFIIRAIRKRRRAKKLNL